MVVVQGSHGGLVVVLQPWWTGGGSTGQPWWAGGGIAWLTGGGIAWLTGGGIAWLTKLVMLHG